MMVFGWCSDSNIKCTVRMLSNKKCYEQIIAKGVVFVCIVLIHRSGYLWLCMLSSCLRLSYVDVSYMYRVLYGYCNSSSNISHHCLYTCPLRTWNTTLSQQWRVLCLGSGGMPQTQSSGNKKIGDNTIDVHILARWHYQCFCFQN